MRGLATRMVGQGGMTGTLSAGLADPNIFTALFGITGFGDVVETLDHEAAYAEVKKAALPVIQKLFFEYTPVVLFPKAIVPTPLVDYPSDTPKQNDIPGPIRFNEYINDFITRYVHGGALNQSEEVADSLYFAIFLGYKNEGGNRAGSETYS